MEDESTHSHREEVDTSTRSFDYNLLEASKRLHIQTMAEDIRIRMKRTAEDIIAIGRDLIEVKSELDHGLFQKWLQAEFEMSDSTATKFMQVATRFADVLPKSVKMTNLPATVLYSLAAPSTPDEVVQQVLSGEIPANAEAIRDAKEAIKKAQDEQAQEQKERLTVEARLLNVNYELQGTQEELKKMKQDRDRLKKIVDREEQNERIQMKAENTFLGLITHGMQLFAEIQQYLPQYDISGHAA